mmetsp:Transcript_27526/g.53700  ORF Transcript_27526/g.53700 Transcript_27526/m.53700 type:complete len:217 (-) Transcript_27526:557-1207(-)
MSACRSICCLSKGDRAQKGGSFLRSPSSSSSSLLSLFFSIWIWIDVGPFPSSTCGLTGCCCWGGGAPCPPPPRGGGGQGAPPPQQQQPVRPHVDEGNGPTSIQIQMEKNSDNSDDEEEEGERKKLPPFWARSPLLKQQIERQADMSPTPIFGECKKTCDLGHIFQNHQPKRRKYDKRTSSADWGDDGRASFMEEDRFQRQMMQNMAMQHSSKTSRM